MEPTDEKGAQMKLDKDTLISEVAGHEARMKGPLWSEDGGERLIARWESRSGKHWVSLYRYPLYYEYRSVGAFGTFHAESDDVAISHMATMASDYQPDSILTPMRLACRVGINGIIAEPATILLMAKTILKRLQDETIARSADDPVKQAQLSAYWLSRAGLFRQLAIRVVEATQNKTGIGRPSCKRHSLEAFIHDIMSRAATDEQRVEFANWLVRREQFIKIIAERLWQFAIQLEAPPPCAET